MALYFNKLRQDELISVLDKLSLNDIYHLCTTEKVYSDFCLSEYGQRYIQSRRINESFDLFGEKHTNEEEEELNFRPDDYIEHLDKVSPELYDEYRRESRKLLLNLIMKRPKNMITQIINTVEDNLNKVEELSLAFSKQREQEQQQRQQQRQQAQQQLQQQRQQRQQAQQQRQQQRQQRQQHLQQLQQQLQHLTQQQ